MLVGGGNMLFGWNGKFCSLFEIIEGWTWAILLITGAFVGTSSISAKPDSSISPEAEWTFLVYVQANNSLCPFAQKNFNDMASIASSKDLNILVQWHDPNHDGVWRYKIAGGKMELDMHLPVNIDGNQASDLVDSMNWAVSKYAAKKYALIFWNHGIGILDPAWGDQSMGFMRSNATLNNPRAMIEGLTYIEELPNVSKAVQFDPEHRGILFNERTKTYMNNQTLSTALSAIKSTVLGGKKIDLIGMDACLMAMTEVCYQIRNYAHYFVGSQEVELAFGWGYAPVVQQFVGKPSPQDAAKGIVTSYENLYKQKINFYTQSAVDLSLMGDLKDSINLVVQKLSECREFDQRKVVATLKQARSQTLQFSTTSYIDLHSFFQELQRSIAANLVLRSTSKEGAFAKVVEELKNAIDISVKFLLQAVVANASGKGLSRARGLSVYYPEKGAIDQSYMYTDFVADCRWNDLLLMSRGY